MAFCRLHKQGERGLVPHDISDVWQNFIQIATEPGLQYRESPDQAMARFRIVADMGLDDHQSLVISLHLHWQSNQIRDFSTNTINIGLEVQLPRTGCVEVPLFIAIEDTLTDRPSTGPRISNSPVLFDVHSFVPDSAKVPNLTLTSASRDEETKQI
jgi:hypothetical protein